MLHIIYSVSAEHMLEPIPKCQRPQPNMCYMKYMLKQTHPLSTTTTHTHGSLMLMNILQAAKEMTMKMNAKTNCSVRLSLGMLLLLDLSKIMNPRAPQVKRKEEASPSIMYCPLTLYCINATGLECPFSSVVDPMDGGSTITSYIMPPVTRKYVKRMKANTTMGDGRAMKDGRFNLRFGTSST